MRRESACGGAPELLSEDIAVCLGRARRDAESFTDLFVRAASRDYDTTTTLAFRRLNGSMTDDG